MTPHRNLGNKKQVVQMHIHSSYLHRMTALYAIQVLTESLDGDMLAKVRTVYFIKGCRHRQSPVPCWFGFDAVANGCRLFFLLSARS